MTKKKIKFNYIKSVISAFAIPIIYILLWNLFSPNTLNEFQLLTFKTNIAPGQITKAEEVEDYVQTDNDRKPERTLDFYFDYTFEVPNRKLISSFGSEEGGLPDDLLDVNTKPLSVEVEYLERNPTISRVKASWTSEISLFKWFRHSFVIGFLGFLFCCSLGWHVFKKGKENYIIKSEST